ncbi:hypothetical protein FRC14_007911 [Serendipita sp. 396]|nr:hypothetical protein FRC14_007911 [Serendipita sp. 396]KAG8781453.1 hypothetical protein FRC15_008725 [Serendipita sp. 397]
MQYDGRRGQGRGREPASLRHPKRDLSRQVNLVTHLSKPYEEPPAYYIPLLYASSFGSKTSRGWLSCRHAWTSRDARSTDPFTWDRIEVRRRCPDWNLPRLHTSLPLMVPLYSHTIVWVIAKDG